MTGSAITIVLVSDHPANRSIANDAAQAAKDQIQRTSGLATAVLLIDAVDLEPSTFAATFGLTPSSDEPEQEVSAHYDPVGAVWFSSAPEPADVSPETVASTSDAPQEVATPAPAVQEPSTEVATPAEATESPEPSVATPQVPTPVHVPNKDEVEALHEAAVEAEAAEADAEATVAASAEAEAPSA